MNSLQSRFLSRRALRPFLLALIAGSGAGICVPAFAQQSSVDTPVGSVVEEQPPRDVASYTLTEIFAAHDPDLLRAALARNPALVRARFENGMTALQIAAQLGDSDSVSILIAAGAGVDVPDYYGRTAIYYALNAKVDCYPVVNVLCLNHANLFWYDVNGDFVYDIAFRLNNPRVLSCFETYHAPRRIDYPDSHARELAHRTFISESRVRVVPKVVIRHDARVEGHQESRAVVVHQEPRVVPGREVVVPGREAPRVEEHSREEPHAAPGREVKEAPHGEDHRPDEHRQ